MWGGRFEDGPSALLLRVNASIGFDRRLVGEDVLGSIAHARMLAEVGILDPEQALALESGLLEVLARFRRGEVVLSEELEDIHTHVEHGLRAAVGPDLAGRLHTGRSRNDQVVTDEMLWLRAEVGSLRGATLAAIEALVDKARTGAALPLVGLTHLQPAQPVTAGHHLLAHAWALVRDEERLADLRARVRYCPLGSGSLAASPLGLDRARVAALLGFEGGPSPNTMDSVSDRDLLAELCQAAALCGVHASRLAEDLILWASPAQGFVRLPDSCCTGSSLMPQKKNPDALELVRGKSARLVGNATRLLVLLKGQPLAYNKDLQEDKEAAFDSADQLADVLGLVRLSVSGMEFVPERCRASVADRPELLATDLADYLVTRGLPFRRAHEVVGRVVAEADRRGLRLDALGADTLRSFDPAFAEDVGDWLDPDRSLARRNAVGGPAPEAVREGVDRLEAWLSERRARLEVEHAPSPLLAELVAAGRWTG